MSRLGSSDSLRTTVYSRLAEGGAVTAVACYDLTTALGAVAAAEARERPLVLLVPPAVAGTGPGLRLVRALRGLADDASVAVEVQLDHARDVELMVRCVSAGATAVLADGSHLTSQENADLVARAVASLPAGTSVEAELGALAGDEDRAGVRGTAPAGMTDPEQVAAFLDRSGASLLAVAVGNAHGTYDGTPHLDWDLLARIRTEAGEVPLVLHGASGLPRADLARCGVRGIGKVNVNTEVRQATLAHLGQAVGAAQADGADMRSLVDGWRELVSSTVGGFLDLLDPPAAQ